MLLSIHPLNPQPRLIQNVVEVLKSGGVIIYPTDTLYGLGCDIYNTSAIERICRIKNINPKKAQFSFVCNDLKHLSDFAKSISNPLFRILKNSLPGPYTFILEASKQVPKMLKSKKDTVGIRVPDHAITQSIVQALGNPIMSVSLPIENDVAYYTDPETIYQIFEKQVDLIIEGGIGGTVPSTVIDCTQWPPEIIRMGAGAWDISFGG